MSFFRFLSITICILFVNGTKAEETQPNFVKSVLDSLTTGCSYTDQTTCDNDSACSWCKSAAVPSECVPTAKAKQLPPAVFACDKVGLHGPEDIPCRQYTDSQKCYDNKTCTWCQSYNSPPRGMCLTYAGAHSLPSKEYWCYYHNDADVNVQEKKKPLSTLQDRLSTLMTSADCTQYSDETSCDANTTCTWCKAGAIPSECVTVAQAAKLPPGVFECDHKKSALGSTLTNDDKSDSSDFSFEKLLSRFNDFPRAHWDVVITRWSGDDALISKKTKQVVNVLDSKGDLSSLIDDSLLMLQSITQQVDVCPKNTVECDYAPGKVECCSSAEGCIPHVGCRCASDSLCMVFRR